MKNYQIAIALPSYNEEKSIAHVASVVDKGLSQFYDYKKCILINIDSKSTDRTIKTFNNTNTKCDKISITPTFKIQGKGQNLKKFFKYTQRHNIKYLATIDTDLESIEPDWIKNLLSPVMNHKCDYVTPLYSRNRFEGSTTNHFAVPIIYSLFNKIIRQPIGGEFALNRKVADYILKQKFIDDTYQYGIDIFMTMHALGGGFKVGEVYLGKKFHKPSFPNIESMFKQVSNTALSCYLDYYDKNMQAKFINLQQSDKTGIDEKSLFKHKDKVDGLIKKQTQFLFKNIHKYKKILPDQYEELAHCLDQIQPAINTVLWSNLLANFIKYFIKNQRERKKFGQLLVPLFLLRTANFWSFSEKSTPAEIEREIIKQTRLIKTLT